MHDSATSANRPVRIIQITDCHLGADSEYRLAGVRPYYSFMEVLQRIGAAGEPVDRIMVTGDIAAQGVAPAYQLFCHRMAGTGLPYSWLPGNHDVFERMCAHSLLPPFEPVVAVGRWRLLCLNTAVPEAVGGYLDGDQLAAVGTTLEALEDHPVALFMHHPPTAIGCRWLDRQQVANGEELAAILRRHPQVRAVFTGHVHQEGFAEFAGIPLYTTPSTCFQFAAGSDDFAIATEPPAYRWIDLHSDGSHATGIVAIADTAERVDTHISGY
ncbi:MAG: phosphodiesterase [Porticoccaceae bacterium]